MVCRYRSQFWAAEINIVIFIQRLDGGSGKQGSHDLVFPPVTITSIARDCGGSFLTAMRERAVLNDFHLWITPRTASAPFVCVAPCFEISAPYFLWPHWQNKAPQAPFNLLSHITVSTAQEALWSWPLSVFLQLRLNNWPKNMHVHKTIRH